MKRLIAFALAIVFLFSLASCNTENIDENNTSAEPTDTSYQVIAKINHYVVEPDDKLHMDDTDTALYQALMDAMLSQKDSVTLSENTEKNAYLLDLLMQSPYYFFVKSHVINDGTVSFTYAYSKDEQNDLLTFIDNEFLDIVNTHATKDDNLLDRILNVYGAVARKMVYDHGRTKDMALDSPLFHYPADEIYKALKTEKSVCYGFAYTLRFALLQLGVDCFCVYGPCRDQGESHMWNIFKYNDKFYTCDPAWDRSEGDYAQLTHFGKTDAEREADSLVRSGFSSTFFTEYGDIACTDKTFKIFRNIDRYSFVSTHNYFLEDFDHNEYIFNTQTMELE